MAEPVRLVVHPVHGPGLVELLAAHGGLMVEAPGDADGVVAALATGAAGLITYAWEDRFATGAIRWVQSLSTGVDQFPLDLLAERGIVLTSARHAHTPAVAEHAIALMMAIVRGVGPAIRRAVGHEWQPGPAHEVSGRTVGVLGLGSIGTAIAEKAAALGMDVIGTKRDPAAYRGVGEALRPEQTLDVFRRADVVIIALPGDASTAGLVGAVELEALGPGWLVNVGRGNIVDEEALIQALTEGDLRGAGLDVTATEPLPADSPLWDLPEVTLTPHMAWASDHLAGRLAEIIVANARAFAGDGQWVNRVV